MAAPQQPPVTRSKPADSSAHKPYVPDETKMPEFTWQAVLLGAVLGIVFGASSLYLVLKVGMTVSASIPVAVLSITLFRVFSRVFGWRPATILENNIVQTTGSAGESIAFGVGVTMPALMLLGFDMDIGRVMVVSVLGGTLGILMMIPLRRAFIVRQHGKLKYPEGTACADVLIVGEKGGSSATTVFVGFGIAAVYQILWQGFKLWREYPTKALSWFKGAVASIEVNPALLGIGYIIGTKISCIMVAGGVLAAFVIVPAIRLFGDGLLRPLYPGTSPISQMSDASLRNDYVLYIGAGAVAAGGIISLIQALPLIFSSIRSAFSEMRAAKQAGNQSQGIRRTDQDLPMWIVLAGSVLLVGAIWATTPLHAAMPWIPDLGMNVWGAIMIVLFGFLFVTVSSRLTGEIGSSSNPISGMTVATLLLTCGVFLILGKTSWVDQLTALSVAGVVCIAASNGGTTSQDLKTGFLVGGTPKWQQLAIMVGAISSSLVVGVILVTLNRVGTVYSSVDLPTPATAIDVSSLDEYRQAPDDPTRYHVWRAREGNPQRVPRGEYLVDDQGRIRYLVDPGINGVLRRRSDGTEVQKYDAPKALLMAFITEGMLNQNLPWELVLLGVAIALMMELCGVPSLPFAVGVYLPLSSSAPIFVGGMVRYFADTRFRKTNSTAMDELNSDMSPGVLLSTGYIAGGTLAAVMIAFLSFGDTIPKLLSTWQYRTAVVTEDKPVEKLYRDLARSELAPAKEPLNAAHHQNLDSLESTISQSLAGPNANRASFRATPEQLGRAAIDKKRLLELVGVEPTASDVVDELLLDAQTIALAHEIAEMNQELLPRNAAVSPGTVLTLPKGEQYRVEKGGTLGEIASEKLGSVDKAPLLYDLNANQLRLPRSLPRGTEVRLPQKNWPALLIFGILALFLLIVAKGWLFKPAGSAPKAKPAS